MQFCDLIPFCELIMEFFCYSINVLSFPCIKSMYRYTTQQNAYRSQNYPVTMALIQITTKLSAQLIFINEAKQV